MPSAGTGGGSPAWAAGLLPGKYPARKNVAQKPPQNSAAKAASLPGSGPARHVSHTPAPHSSVRYASRATS